MDTYCFKKVKSSSILILIERDDGTKKKQTLERTTMRKRLSKYIFYSSFSLLTFATKK